ncbi:MAG: hypothetical protein KAT43_00050 [Nanoarchaeota archaeon]|nr:hypothetical protein [Nanoarchaeota archaeon]
MAYEIIVGRKEIDRKLFGTKGTVMIGKQYVTMGRTTSLSNPIYLDVAKAHVIFVVGKRGSGKCLHGDSLITLDDGSVTSIKDLETNKEGVLALNENLKITQSQKSAFYKRKTNKLIHLRLRSGKELKLTPEHPLFTVKGWTQVQKLNLNARIATPRKLDVFGNEDLEEHKVKLLAYLIAEGHLGNNFVLFSNFDDTILNDFKASVEEFDGSLTVRVHSKEGCYRVGNKISKTNWRIFARDSMGRILKSKYTGTRNSMKYWLEDLNIYNKKAIEKEIPKTIFKLPRAKLALFLNRLFSCDGSLYNTNNYWEISYSSSSLELIRQVQHLLLRFEIISRLRFKTVNNFKTYELVIGGELVEIFLQNIGFYGQKEVRQKIALKEAIKIIRNPNIDTIPKEIWSFYKPDNWAAIGRKMNYAHPKALRESIRYSPSRQKLLQIARLDENELMEKFACSDIFWDEIVSMEELNGEFTVYDLTVPNWHNFVANDIIVHNSYSMGAIAEGIMDLPKEISQNISMVILDTMGIYWTMKYPNQKDIKLLDEWDIKPRGLDVQIFTPVGMFEKYKEEGVPTDFAFAIQPNELDAEDWCRTFDIDRNSEIGVLIEKIVNFLKDNKETFSLQDIINALDDEPAVSKTAKEAAKNRFLNAQEWGLFHEKGTMIADIVIAGKISVLDVSAYATMPNGWAIKSLVIGLISKKLFIERMRERKAEEIADIKATIEYFKGPEAKQKKKEPLVWLIIDEAHEFLPLEGATTATDPLITILREGRQPGISLILASQQPGKIHTDVMTQADTVLSHRLTAKMDTDSLKQLAQSYMREGIEIAINNLPRVPGAAVLLDDTNERVFPMRVRPRITWHGGGEPSAIPKKKEATEF